MSDSNQLESMTDIAQKMGEPLPKNVPQSEVALRKVIVALAELAPSRRARVLRVAWVFYMGGDDENS